MEQQKHQQQQAGYDLLAKFKDELARSGPEEQDRVLARARDELHPADMEELTYYFRRIINASV